MFPAHVRRARLLPASRVCHSNPRALGTNPRALGVNPRARVANPRAWQLNPKALAQDCRQPTNEGEEKPVWSLQWVWLHPYLREKGHLKKAWPVFIEDLGEPVEVEAPYSRAMEAFLTRADPATLARHTREAVCSGKPLRLAKNTE